MGKRTFLFMLMWTVLLSACAGTAGQMETATSSSLRHLRLPMGYIPNVQYAPFYVAVDKGYFAQAGLAIDFDYAPETDGLTLVGSNDVQFALVSGEQVLLARAQGLPVVYIFAWWQDYPVAVAAPASSGIAVPKDLVGKRIGIPGTYGASYIGLRALLNAAGISESQVSLQSVGYNQIAALTAGQVDAIVVYANNEPIQLEAQGVPVNLIRVADYVHLASNGLISNESTIASDPSLVSDFVGAVRRGVIDTLSDPQAAFEISKSYVEGLSQADQSVQMKVLLASADFWKASDPGLSDPRAWENMQSVLLKMGLIPSALDLSRCFTNRFVPQGADG
jgi:NitT/TauT family transport system substrate-binding protein